MKNKGPDLEAFQQLAQSPSSTTAGWIRKLTKAWGNPGFRAGQGYLRRIAQRAASVNGPILECGSGLSTIMMGILTKHSGTTILALEHNAEWCARVQCVLDFLALDHVEVRHCPVINYGLYDWYDVSSALPSDIRLVVCDGPPGRDTRGGRYGMLPKLKHHFHEDCVILLDDTHRRGEKRVMRTWSRRMPFRIQNHGTLFRFAEMTAAL